MKKSAQPMEYVFIRAYTGSEWDYCDFAIIRLTDEWRNEMGKRLALLEPFKADNSFYSLNYGDWPEGFYQNIIEDEEDIMDVLLSDGGDWTFITIGEDELQMLPKPANALGGATLVLNKDGTANFTASGKHTDENFWTADFEVEKLINAS